MPNDLIDEYLAELRSRLLGPPRARAAIVAELSCGLQDAVEDHMSRGLPAGPAAKAAIEEFGSPRELAAEFVSVAATAQVHRYGLRFMAAGPLIGFLWLIAAALSSLDAMPEAARSLLGLTAIVMTTAASCAVFSIAATSRPTVAVKLTTVVQAISLTARCVIVGDLTLLAVLVLQTASAPDDIAALPVVVAAAASVARLIVATRSTRRLRHTGAMLAQTS